MHWGQRGEKMASSDQSSHVGRPVAARFLSHSIQSLLCANFPCPTDICWQAHTTTTYYTAPASSKPHTTVSHFLQLQPDSQPRKPHAPPAHCSCALHISALPACFSYADCLSKDHSLLPSDPSPGGHISSLNPLIKPSCWALSHSEVM